MRLFHKALILISLTAIVHTVISYFMGDDINKWALLTAAIVLIHNMRELQFEGLKGLLDVTLYNNGVIMDAIRKEFGTEGMLRIRDRSLDILSERAPEEIRGDVSKLAEALKKLNNKEVNHEAD